MEKLTRILVLGGGNGAHTLSGTASALNNVDVNVLSLHGGKRWSAALGDDKIAVHVTHKDGRKGQLLGKPKLITNDPAEAMTDVDAVFFVVPAFAHQQYFDAISHYIQPNTLIIGMPGHAGFEFQAFKSLQNKASQCAIISIESLPWSCRITEFGREVLVMGGKDVLGLSLFSGNGKYPLTPVEYVQTILGPKPLLKPKKNYIEVNLMARSILHPPILYSKWRTWDGKPLAKKPLFFLDVDDEQAGFLVKVSDELMATAKEIHRQKSDIDMSEVIPIHDWYKVYYRDVISDNSSLKTCLQTNQAYSGIVYPMKQENGGYVPDFTHRYMAEDIPFGLVVMKGIAECVGVKTPMMDEIITWGQQKLGKKYIIGSQLTGKDLKETRAPQVYGLNSLDDLCKLAQNISP